MKYNDLPERIKNNIYQSLVFIYSSSKMKSPHEKVLEFLDKKEKSSKKWRSFCYWKMEKVKKLREKMYL